LGYGCKQILTLEQKKNALTNPSPDAYIHTEFQLNSKTAKTFGINMEFYKKDQMPNINPGPGSYFFQKQIGHDSQKVGFKGDRSFKDSRFQTPSPSQYNINNSLTQDARYKYSYKGTEMYP
jgi:hypothetical protein